MGAGPPRIDRPILEDIQHRLQTTTQVSSVTFTGPADPTALIAHINPDRNPPDCEERSLNIRWDTNDDFRIHYRETWTDYTYHRRWDRHPNPHNTPDHEHPPPDAATPGTDREYPADYRDVLTLVSTEIQERTSVIWAG